MEEPVVVPKPPRRISDAPSARNLKPRRISAIRRWPPGCGRSAPPRPPPPSDVSPPSDPPARETASIGSTECLIDNSVKTEGFCETAVTVESIEGQIGMPVENGGFSENKLKLEVQIGNDAKLEGVSKRWMNSKVFPPPKWRPVSAVRRFPPGCGRNLNLNLNSNSNLNSSSAVELAEKMIDAEIKGKGLSVNEASKDKDKNDKSEVILELVKGSLVKYVESEKVKGKSVATDEQAVIKPIKIAYGEKKRTERDEKESTESPKDIRVSGEGLETRIPVPKKKVLAKKRVGIKIIESSLYSITKRPDLHTGFDIDSTKRESREREELEELEEDSPNPLDTNSNREREIEPSQRLPRKQARKSNYNPNPSSSRRVLSNTQFNREEKLATRINERESRAITVYNKAKSKAKFDLTVNVAPLAPSGRNRPSDARTRVKRTLRLFHTLCRRLLQQEESGLCPKEMAINRIDLKAADMVKKTEGYVKHSKAIVGSVPGVEVGDEFRYRVELHLIGLHRPLQSGIDCGDHNGVRVAVSIVASGGYSDDVDNSGVLIYTGEGGRPKGKKGNKTQPEDQKLERGNLALKHSMDLRTPVRVIHGIKETNENNKIVSTFYYDGLYIVEQFWIDVENYTIDDGVEASAHVFRFRLKRIAGQPELTIHQVAQSKKSKLREGLCVSDISQGREKMLICAINTVDDEKPPKFNYITKIVYPPWYEKITPKGCNCNGKCSDSTRCACAIKNGGEIPFNHNGAVVHAKTLIYECGPACRCGPTCHNRVSQHGIKIPLEIFKTENRGWGVRSLSSIPSGSFICEYAGELLQDKDAELRDNDTYLFDIGHNYNDSSLWAGLPGFSNDNCSEPDSDGEETEGFTIDAAERGNVGRFINHSCSPNLYAQNILYDHGDKKIPHIMFFAAENIPPLQELTYHYNYRIGTVTDSEGREKRKDCYCGAADCEGRLY